MKWNNVFFQFWVILVIFKSLELKYNFRKFMA